jgi:hypothetical protein
MSGRFMRPAIRRGCVPFHCLLSSPGSSGDSASCRQSVSFVDSHHRQKTIINHTSLNHVRNGLLRIGVSPGRTTCGNTYTSSMAVESGKVGSQT